MLTTDRTPDVPLRTSDFYLQDVLVRAAAAAGEPVSRLTDRLLAEAWKDRKTWEADIRLLDRVGKTFGMWSPRSLAELEEQAGSLPAFSQSIADLNEAWSDGQEDLNVGRLTRFVESNPSWQARLQTARLDQLPQAERRKLTAELLAALASFDLGRDRLLALHERSELAATLDYRMEVRTGALLRLRSLLAGVAGRVYLSRPGREKERQGYLDLLACEDLQLPAEKNPRPLPAATPESFPPFAEDVAATEKLVPTYMGISFQSVRPEQQKRHNLPSGAAVINRVFPDSPAQKAGLLPGDVILGLPGKPFTLHNEVRVWTYFASAGTPQTLEVLRGDQRQQMILVPQRRPDRLPSLPEPPRNGIPAPALSLTPFRGAIPSRLDGGSSHLLFFWGTFCGPCKASLPEVLAFSRARGVPGGGHHRRALGNGQRILFRLEAALPLQRRPRRAPPHLHRLRGERRADLRAGRRPGQGHQPPDRLRCQPGPRLPRLADEPLTPDELAIAPDDPATRGPAVVTVPNRTEVARRGLEEAVIGRNARVADDWSGKTRKRTCIRASG